MNPLGPSPSCTNNSTNSQLSLEDGVLVVNLSHEPVEPIVSSQVRVSISSQDHVVSTPFHLRQQLCSVLQVLLPWSVRALHSASACCGRSCCGRHQYSSSDQSIFCSSTTSSRLNETGRIPPFRSRTTKTFQVPASSLCFLCSSTST